MNSHGSGTAVTANKGRCPREANIFSSDCKLGSSDLRGCRNPPIAIISSGCGIEGGKRLEQRNSIDLVWLLEM